MKREMPRGIICWLKKKSNDFFRGVRYDIGLSYYVPTAQIDILLFAFLTCLSAGYVSHGTSFGIEPLICITYLLFYKEQNLLISKPKN